MCPLLVANASFLTIFYCSSLRLPSSSSPLLLSVRESELIGLGPILNVINVGSLGSTRFVECCVLRGFVGNAKDNLSASLPLEKLMEGRKFPEGGLDFYEFALSLKKWFHAKASPSPVLTNHNTMLPKPQLSNQGLSQSMGDIFAPIPLYRTTPSQWAWHYSKRV